MARASNLQLFSSFEITFGSTVDVKVMHDLCKVLAPNSIISKVLDASRVLMQRALAGEFWLLLEVRIVNHVVLP